MSLPESHPPGQDSPLASLQSIGPFFTLGIQLAFFVIAFFFMGRWADSKLGTTPWLMVVGIVMGVGGGLYKFVQTVTELTRKQDKLDEQRRHKGL